METLKKFSRKTGIVFIIAFLLFCLDVLQFDANNFPVSTLTMALQSFLGYFLAALLLSVPFSFLGYLIEKIKFNYSRWSIKAVVTTVLIYLVFALFDLMTGHIVGYELSQRRNVTYRSCKSGPLLKCSQELANSPWKRISKSEIEVNLENINSLVAQDPDVRFKDAVVKTISKIKSSVDTSNFSEANSLTIKLIGTANKNTNFYP